MPCNCDVYKTNIPNTILFLEKISVLFRLCWTLSLAKINKYLNKKTFEQEKYIYATEGVFWAWYFRLNRKRI